MDPDVEIRDLRTTLRDLVALSCIPAVWVGREPPDIAQGLVDVLVGTLHLDFAFVRLCDPGGGTEVEATRGDGWPAFPEWLRQHVAVGTQLSAREIVAHVGGADRRHGVLMPIGLNAEGGLVAAACDGTDFPTEIDQVLLSLAVSHASTALQHARLQQELRRARHDLEIEVAQRTAELRRSEEQWRDVFANNPTMYFMVDATGTILAVNPCGAEVLGYTIDELVGRPALSVCYEPDRAAIQRNVAICLGQLGRARSWEARNVRQDGEVLWVRCTAKAVDRLTGPIVLIACEDVTEKKRAEEALRQAQVDLAHVSRVTTMGEMAASIAHEVSQPLSGVLINANAGLRWLGADPPRPEEAREALHRIIRDGKRASEVIVRVTALSKKATDKERLDLNRVIREVLSLAYGEVTNARVLLTTAFAPDLPHVMGDRIQLQQVVLNLILNGIEAMSSVVDRPRELTIGTFREGANRARVVVKDSGVGLTPDTANRIFDAFYTTKRSGMGMGLSISRSIVENHGGKLWAEPNDGPGTTLQFTVGYA